jgi:hypothetical protein
MATELAEALDTVEKLANAALARGEAVPEQQLAAAFAALARLSAARCEQEPALPVARDALTATETVTVVSGLLRAADLNVFDLAMWFRRSA